MAKIRKLNVSEIAGRSPFNNNNDAVMPAGTIVVYEGDNEGEYVLRVHDGVTNGGVPFPNAPSIIHNNDINITVDSGDSSSYTWNFGQTGDLTIPGNIVFQNGGYIEDSESFFVGTNDGFQIQTNKTAGAKVWDFGTDGVLTLPTSGDIVDSEGNSVLGGGSNVDNNIWVETFALTDPEESIVQIATSVEYDADGNIFALFSHNMPGIEYETYKSVAKLTPTGAVLWQVRFGANLNTDGWGLAYDGADSVYIAGSTSGTPLTYNLATLTKIDAADGTSVWSKTYDFGSTSRSAVVDVDSDLNPIMVGWADTPGEENNRIITTKVDQATGSVVWSRTLDGQGDDEAYGMAVGPSGEVVTVGYVPQLGIIDAAATLYTEPASNPNWTTGVSGPVGGVNFSSVTFTDGVPTFANVSDTLGNRTVDGVLGVIGGNAFGGTSPADDMTVKVATLAANDNDNRMIVVKYAANGTIAWQKAVQFEVGYDCKGADADIDADGNIYVCGSYDNIGGEAMSLIKFNSSGVKQWSRQVIGNCQDFATSVVVGPDNNLYLSGVTIDDANEDIVWVVAKYSAAGTVVWQRLIDNTASWTFAGGTFIGEGGGSNIAVRNGYVALGGGFGVLENDEPPTAAVVQIDTNGTTFSTGDWDFTGASFSGTLDDDASGITVVDAGKVSATATPAVADFVVMTDDSNFLAVTRYSLSGGGNELNNGEYVVALGNTGILTLPTGATIFDNDGPGGGWLSLAPANASPGQALVIYPTAGGEGDHIHLTADGGATELYLGNDDHYVKLVNGGNVQIQAATANLSATAAWTFETDGDLYIPGDIKSTTDISIVAGNTSSIPNIFIAAVDYQAPFWRVFVNSDTYPNLGIAIQVGDTFTTGWGTPVTATIQQILDDRVSSDQWVFYVDQDVLTGWTYEDEATFNPVPETWTFGNDGSLTFPDATVQTTAYIPGNIRSEGNINIDVNLSDSTLRRWQFGEDGVFNVAGDLRFPDGTTYSGNDITVPSGVPSGAVTKITGNQGWDGNNVGINLPTTGGSGTGLTVDVEDSGSFYSAITINTPGSGYSNGDVITVTRPDVSETFTITVPAKTWTFGTDGDITLPAGGNVVDNGGVSQLANRVEGSWTLPDDSTDTYSFTVPSDGTYVMWVKGNIPNGIITWNATVSVSNSNVPAIGSQYAWNYTGGGSPILLTSIPDQIRGSAGTISTDATYVGSTSNRFDFGISNTSGSTRTVYYGYTKI
jgi:hypothetical protein